MRHNIGISGIPMFHGLRKKYFLQILNAFAL
jgi:hypothetical protein